MTDQHPYNKLALPNNAPFELKPSPGKGWGVFSTRDIQPGEIILDEAALFSIPPRFNLEAALSRQESTMLNSPQLALLRAGGTRGEESPTMREVFGRNSFRQIDKHGKYVGDGLYVIASRFNHSCTPNCIPPKSDAARGDRCVTFVAAKPIAKGTELTVKYCGMLECLTRDERRDVLVMEAECQCDTCSLQPAMQQMSDMRRHIIRGLYFLIFHHDIAKEHHQSLTPKLLTFTDDSIHSPIRGEHPLSGGLVVEEMDSEFRDDAEDFCIPLTSRFVYGCLALSMMEQEETLNEVLEGRIVSVLEEVLLHVKDPLFYEIFDNVLRAKNETWSQRFNDVRCFHDYSDDGDEPSHEVLMAKLLVLGQQMRD